MERIDAPIYHSLIGPDSALSADKYAVAVIKAREVVALNARYKTEKQPDLKERLSSRLDAFLGFLINQFKVLPSSGEVKDAMYNNQINALNVNELLLLPDSLIPVTLIRELMRKHRLAVDVRNLNNWSNFQERYETQILLS